MGWIDCPSDLLSIMVSLEQTELGGLVTLGLQFYLGKNEEHADWYIAADKVCLPKKNLLPKSTELKIC